MLLGINLLLSSLKSRRDGVYNKVSLPNFHIRCFAHAINVTLREVLTLIFRNQFCV